MPNPKKIRIENRALLDSFTMKPCDVCRKAPPNDPSHIKSRGSGGDDTEENLKTLCRKHHVEWHQYGPTKFVEWYPKIEALLAVKGWKLERGKISRI
jgi:hypothetical protein